MRRMKLSSRKRNIEYDIQLETGTKTEVGNIWPIVSGIAYSGLAIKLGTFVVKNDTLYDEGVVVTTTFEKHAKAGMVAIRTIINDMANGDFKKHLSSLNDRNRRITIFLLQCSTVIRTPEVTKMETFMVKEHIQGHSCTSGAFGNGIPDIDVAIINPEVFERDYDIELPRDLKAMSQLPSGEMTISTAIRIEDFISPIDVIICEINRSNTDRVLNASFDSDGDVPKHLTSAYNKIYSMSYNNVGVYMVQVALEGIPLGTAYLNDKMEFIELKSNDDKSVIGFMGSNHLITLDTATLLPFLKNTFKVVIAYMHRLLDDPTIRVMSIPVGGKKKGTKRVKAKAEVVRAHVRHYKSGKVTFVKSYIRGKSNQRAKIIIK